MGNEFPKDLKRGDDSRKNWREINELTRLNKALSWKLDDSLRRIVKLEGIGGIWQAGGGGVGQRFRVISEEGDYLICQKENAAGTPDGIDVNVAKPRTIRLATWNGQTIGDWRYNGTQNTRDAIYAGAAVVGGLQPGDLIAEILDPPYTGGELIASQVAGETGVTVLGARLTWLDINADARRFVAKRDRVDVCKLVNGIATPMKLVLDGGPAF